MVRAQHVGQEWVVTMEFQHVIGILALLVSLASMLVVSRNARRATSVNEQTLALARIRDLRSELTEAETKTKQLSAQLTEATEFGNRMLRERMEMIRYAQMPGVGINDWLDRFGDSDHPRPIAP